MKAIFWICLLIFICACTAANDDGLVAYHNWMEANNCRFSKFRRTKTACGDIGGECISGGPPVIRHYEATDCECGTSCCVWLT